MKEELLELAGTVIEKLPNAMFRVIRPEKCANSASVLWSATKSTLK